MRRIAALGIAVATSVALAVPAFVGPADASAHRAPTSSRAASAHAPTVDRKKAPKLKVKRSKKGVQPGITGEKITALPGKGAKGKVKFLLKGTGLKQARKVKIKKGRAVFAVPPLGTGTYKVKVSYKNRRGKTTFEVYDSALTVNATSFTVSKTAIVYPKGDLNGIIKYKGKPATAGYVDLYKDGNVKGGASSPDFLGFGDVAANGTFDYQSFGDNVADKYAPGTYTFQAYYTPTASFSDYISSNFITVTVTP